MNLSQMPNIKKESEPHEDIYRLYKNIILVNGIGLIVVGIVGFFLVLNLLIKG